MKHFFRSHTLLFLIFSGINIFGQYSEIIKKLNAYDVKQYLFDVEVSHLNPKINGYVEILVEMLIQDQDTIVLELTDNAVIDSILIDSVPASFEHTNNLIFIKTDQPFPARSLLALRVYYSAERVSEIRNRGISTQMTESGKSVSWTLSEPFYSRNWFPCKQVLDDKADSLLLKFTCDDSVMVGSNGLLMAVNNLSEGKKQYVWESHYPVAYYLISFAVADYMDYSFYTKLGEYDSLLVQNFIYDDSVVFHTNKSLIDLTGPLLELFHESFGPYPFLSEKYGHCLTPVGGGMEHQTMTTIGSFDFRLVAHELAHQWFGDNVTCQNWQDIWLNEGFASYSEYIAFEELNPDMLHGWLSDAHTQALSQPNSSVYVPDIDSANASRIFDYSLSYRKGAYLLHMLRHETGDDLFFNILKTFQENHKNSVAQSQDFIEIAEVVSQQELDVFFNQWLYGEGYPILNVKWSQKNDSLSIEIKQETSTPVSTPFFNLLIDFRISHLDGDTIVSLRQTQPAETFKIKFSKRVYRITPDPERRLLARIDGVERDLGLDSISQFSVFPNPSSDRVYIENYNIGLPFTAKLINSEGKLIYELEGSDPFVVFELEPLAAGFYQIVVIREQYRQVFKIAKL